MHDAFLIAKREYLEHVRSKTFLFTTLIVPLLMTILMGGSLTVHRQETDAHRTLVIAANDLQLAEGVKAELESQAGSRYTVNVLAPVTGAVRDELTQAVDAEQYDGFLWLQVEPGQIQPKAIYEARSSADLTTADLLEYAISQATTRRQLAQLGVPLDKIDRLLQPVKVETLQVKNGHASSSNAIVNFAGAYVMILLLFFSVVYYGMNVARSVIQEKTSRVFEVLLASTCPESLMAGKLIGVGGAGLTQIGVWLCAVVILSGSHFAASLGGTAGLASLGISATQIVFFVIFFLLGFLFYSALSAAFGASVSSEQEIQQFSFIILLPLIAGMVLMPYITDNPGSPGVVVLSLFPPCTPIVMFLRMASQAPPIWQLALSIVLMVAAIWAMLWISSRIYRVGILMYGKRPTLTEILRWLRYS